MRKYLAGFLMGIVVMSGIGYADDIKASVMDCTMWLNGGQQEMKEPILNYNGRSYVPLRVFGEMLEADIVWNGETKAIEVKHFAKVETKEVIKEVPVEVVKEVVKEIPITKTEYKYIDVPKEVIKEVIKEVPVDRIVYVQVPVSTQGSSSTTSNAEYNLKMYNYEVAQIKARYDQKRSEAQVSSQLGAKNFNEFLAARGQSGGGAAKQAESSRMADLQNTFNQLNSQEQSELDYLKIKYNIQ